MLQEHENSVISLNLNANLIDMFHEFKIADSLEIIKDLRTDKKLEILSTAKYHPILPLILNNEAERQILLNENIHKSTFENWKRGGFFPPELSINSDVLKLIHDLGYKWIIMSGLACPVDWPYDQIYTSPEGLRLFFRDDILSNMISFNSTSAKKFVSHLKTMFNNETQNDNNDKYVIIAMDSETFGHHHKNYEKLFLSKALDLINDEDEIQTILVSDLEKYFPTNKDKIVPRESSWSTTDEDLQQKIPFPLWKNPNNNIHRFFWKMVENLNKMISHISNIENKSAPNCQNYAITARWYYDRAICSDTTWWANPDRGIWSPNLTYEGIELLMKSAINSQLALTDAGEADLGESYYNTICYYQGLLLMELNILSQKLCESKLAKKQ
jgi:alpha-amylase/alpha-mannosidase (GH57 family)